MSQNKKKLAKNSLIYALFTLLQRGFAFFLIPLYTTQLSTEEYGILGIVMAAIPFFVLIAGLSLRGSTAYFYYEFKDNNPDYLKKLWGSSFTLVVLLSVCFACFLWLSKSFILDAFFNDIPFYPYLLLALISVATQPVYYYYQSMLKAKQEANRAALLDFVYFFIIISLTILFILYFKFKAEGALLALAISNVIFFFYSIYGALKEISFCLHKEQLKKVLKYALPILPHNLSAWAMNLADRIILNSLTTLSLVGLFDIGSQIGKLINVITLGVNSAYSPWFFEQLKASKENKNVIANVTNKIVLLYILFATAISWLAPELLKLISNEAFHTAWTVVPFIAYAFVVNGFYYSFSNVFFLEKTKYLPIITGVGAIINIALNFIFIPLYGIMGAAIANILAKSIFALIAYTVSQKLYYIPYQIKKIILFIVLGFIISCTPYIFQEYLDSLNIWLVILLKTATLGILLTPLVWVNKNIILSYIRAKVLRKNEE
ncbi:MAG: lipopolysaccharide biosynthesis protein [Oceanihabitans sp.]